MLKIKNVKNYLIIKHISNFTIIQKKIKIFFQLKNKYMKINFKI